MFGWLKRIFGSAQDRILRKYWQIVRKVNEWDTAFQGLSDDALRQKTQEFKERLHKGETLDQLLPEAYAVVKQACRRMCGTDVHVSGYDQKWDMIPYDVQILSAIAMHHGCISEMQTGEGKTLTAVMPLYLNALSGKPVHLVTVNDYLAQRDCQWVGAILRWLGLTTGALTSGTPMELRKQIYNSDVVYGTASEFGFDYLRDNSMAMTSQEQVQRGHYFAIIDEVDSILIDEARTPLIISGPSSVSRQMYDEMKQSVSDLVRRQRDLCNRLASETRKVLEKPELPEGAPEPVRPKKDKAEQEAEDAAYRKLWLVGKGTPHNKILRRLKEDPDVRAGLDALDLYYYQDHNKDERATALAELFLTVDERSNEFELTDKGIAAWLASAGEGHEDDFVMLDIAHEYLKIDHDEELDEDARVQRKLGVQEEDAKRKERAHNLRQLLRAHLLMERDIDYIIQDDKVVIIDENTGRPQPGRRFSDGLHQAIEAKEGVSIQQETQTYATITLQNYFRMYEKLSGMTGTALTEAGEFKQIYKLEVLAIPTHKTCRREDKNDEIYMTEREKYNAILKEVREIHEKGCPVLLGTESVEISEKLSRIFKQNQLPHTVLNAKNHEKEAEIIAQAGRHGAITIATNMAGRGTDIKLEAGVAALGGLHVIGTTRHQSRRIDRQLRGRCARQGDPGVGKFFLSFEGSLLQNFSSPRLTKMLQRVRPPEGEPIASPILNRSIETAQKRLEQRHSTMRKNTLEYDDVMNKQRQVLYSFRNEVLHTQDMEALAVDIISNVCHRGADRFLQSRSTEGGWNPEGYRQWLMAHFPVTFEESDFDQDYVEKEELAKFASDKIVHVFRERLEHENNKIPAEHRATMTVLPTHVGLRRLMVRRIDQLWQEHLLKMDHLRADVNLRSVGQRDPLMEFKHESFLLFEDFTSTMNTTIAQDLFRFEIIVHAPPPLEDLLAKLQLETSRSFLNDLEERSNAARQRAPQPAMIRSGASAVPEMSQPTSKAEGRVVNLAAIGRNEQCPCGSGKKYKRCCAPNPESDEE